MKSIKRIMATAALMVSLVATANSGTEPGDNITFNTNKEVVSISVLNNDQATYKVYVYNTQGEMIYKSRLGSDRSLGQQFDFGWAPKGTYQVKVVSSNGKSSVYSVNTGAF